MFRYLLVVVAVFLILSCKEKKANQSQNNEEEISLAQSIPTYNYDELEKNLPKQKNKIYVINFWATWCAPCVEELPHFIKLDEENENIEVVLVSLDMPKMKETQLRPFVEKNKITSKVILLDDVRSNVWIPKVNKDWDGAIPATLVYKNSTEKFYPKQFESYQELFDEIQKIEE